MAVAGATEMNCKLERLDTYSLVAGGGDYAPAQRGPGANFGSSPTVVHRRQRHHESWESMAAIQRATVVPVLALAPAIGDVAERIPNYLPGPARCASSMDALAKVDMTRCVGVGGKASDKVNRTAAYTLHLGRNPRCAFRYGSHSENHRIPPVRADNRRKRYESAHIQGSQARQMERSRRRYHSDERHRSVPGRDSAVVDDLAEDSGQTVAVVAEADMSVDTSRVRCRVRVESPYTIQST